MADYPSQLKDFRAWAKAMEEGARMERPRYKTAGKYRSGKTPNGSRRRKRLTRPRRARREE